MNVLTFKDGEREEDLFKYHPGEELKISHSEVLIIYPAQLINCVYYFSFH